MARLGFLALAASAVLVLGACTANPQPAPSSTDTGVPVVTPSGESTPTEPGLPPVAEPLALKDIVTFSGVAMMNAGSNCTGTLIDTGVPTGPAYILTNGHCTGDVGRPAQSTTLAEEWFGTATFLAAKGNEDNHLVVDVVGLEYSTMRHTDTAIVRLKPTLGELTALGIKPIPLAKEEPDEGATVTNIGVPVQDLMPEDWVLRRGECTLGAQQTLIEFLWTWFGVWSNDCPGIIQGSSGSPLLSLGADGAPTSVVGMINTTTGGSSAAVGGACFLNRPCEVTADGPVMRENTSYAQSVAGIGACFDQQGKFAVGGECPLPTSSIWAAAGGGSFRGSGEGNAFGESPSARFVGRSEGSMRSALVPIGDATACQKPDTYSGATTQPLPLAGEPWELHGQVVTADLPAEEGFYLLCAVSGDDYSGAAGVLFEVDRTPPILPVGADVEDLGGGAMLVQPHLNPPEISTVRFKWGPKDATDCTDTSSFQDFLVVPLVLEPKDLPATYCIYGMDAAGNRTEVKKIDIP